MNLLNIILKDHEANYYLGNCFCCSVDVGVSKNNGTQNRWFIRENPIKMDDLGVPLFLETPMW